MLHHIALDNLKSSLRATRADVILKIAMVVQLSRLDPSARSGDLDGYRFLGLAEDQLLKLDLSSGQLRFLAKELMEVFREYGDSTALWALGKMPIGLATESILRIFEAKGQAFDEEDLWQAGCVLEIGLGANVISEKFWPAFKRFAERCRTSEEPRLQELFDDLRRRPAARGRL